MTEVGDPTLSNPNLSTNTQVHVSTKIHKDSDKIDIGAI